MAKHDLFYDLEAFNPHWQTKYRTVREAASAAKVLDLYAAWLLTDEGKRYMELHTNVPDTLEQIRREREAAERLPFTITSLRAKSYDY